MSRDFGERVEEQGAFVVRFYKFSKMLHLDSLVVGKFLMKVDPEKTARCGSERMTLELAIWRSCITMKLFFQKMRQFVQLSP